MSMKRIIKQVKQLEELGYNLKLGYNEQGHIKEVKILYTCPKQSRYEGHSFILKVQFKEGHPFKPPNVGFTRPVFHPVITDGGKHICTDLFHDTWSPAIVLRLVIKHVDQLLLEKDVHKICDFCNTQAGQLAQQNAQQYDKKVKQQCQKYSHKAPTIEE